MKIRDIDSRNVLFGARVRKAGGFSDAEVALFASAAEPDSVKVINITG